MTSELFERFALCEAENSFPRMADQPKYGESSDCNQELVWKHFYWKSSDCSKICSHWMPFCSPQMVAEFCKLHLGFSDFSYFWCNRQQRQNLERHGLFTTFMALPYTPGQSFIVDIMISSPNPKVVVVTNNFPESRCLHQINRCLQGVQSSQKLLNNPLVKVL